MIVITGATGKLGSRIVARVLERVPPEEVAVSVRDTGRAAALAGRGVRVRHGDFTDPDSLDHAFSGATRVLIVSSDEVGPAAVDRHTAAIDAAVAAGAKRVLYTSHQATSADSAFAPMRDHAATERHLAGTGTPFTALRHGFHADTVPMLLGAALATGELVAPEDGPVSWTTHDDLAAAAAVVLTSADDRFDGATPPLTASTALDLADVAGILTEQTGRTIRRVVVADDEWTAGLVGHGMPTARAAMLLGMFHASRRGEFAVTDPTLTELLGRPATPLHALLRTLH